MADITVDQLQKALKATQELRSSVSLVFEKLHNGIKSTKNTKDKEKAFLSDLRECLSKVNNDVEEVDKLSMSIPTPSGQFLLGNPSQLMVDPILDKTPLHSQVIQTYKWSTKVHEHATLAIAMMRGSAQKRMSMSGATLAKRSRRSINNNHLAPVQHVDQTVATLARAFPDISIVPNRPVGSPAVLQITVGRTIKTLVTLRGLVIEWVIIKGFHEETHHDNGKLDVSSSSKYAVFQKLTQHARSAMLYFHTPHISGGELALRSFLVWLQSYKTLFITPCRKCGRILNDFIPATWHDFTNLDAFHEHCRS